MIRTNYRAALQHPIGTGFNARSEATDVIKGITLRNKTAIVSGGNTGIGLETVKILAAAGATVIVLARDQEKAQRNLQGIPNVKTEAVDITDADSVNAFTERFLASQRPLHLLINNAGIMWVPLRRDKHGIESQLSTNYIGAFRLCAGLWPALKRANGARVINVSSLGHHMSPFRFEDPNFEQEPYETLLAYGQSKTACNLFTMEFDHRAASHHVRAYSVHPGSIAGTELGREASPELFRQMGFLDENGNMPPELLASLKTIAQGAATTVWAATSPLLADTGGVYCEDCDVAELLDDGYAQEKLHKSGVRSYSLNEDHARRLWILTEQMTGILFEVK